MTGAYGRAGGYRLLVYVAGAVLVAAALALVSGARTGALVLALVLLAAAGARARSRSPGFLAVRSRWFDVGFLTGLAVVIGGFALTTAGV